MADGPSVDDVRAWWSTAIVDIEPGKIAVRGHPIEDLIGRISFPAMIWLMLRGELPSVAEADLFGAMLVSAVDHGPQAPSIAIARMTATCGVGINAAIASGINALGDVHGGAGEQAMGFLADLVDGTDGSDEAVAAAVVAYRAEVSPYLPGFGHRFHPVDPRAIRLGELVRAATAEGTVAGRHLAVGLAVERCLSAGKAKPVPMNIDGITAVVLLELGFPPSLGRGVFVLSRAVGLCAHAHEQMQAGGRIKGPTPPTVGYRYTGPPRRPSGEWES